MTASSAPDPGYAAAHDQAAATVAAQVYALVQAAGRHRELTVPQAARAMMRELLADPDNDTGGLAAGVAMLAVAADRGEIGTPFGMLAIPGTAVMYAMLALQDAGCTDTACSAAAGTGPGAAGPVTCSRCTALAQLEEATGLTGGDLAGGGVAA